MTRTDQRVAAARAVHVIGPLPPPVTGAAYVTRSIAERLRALDLTVRIHDTSPGGLGRSSASYHLRRLLAHAKALAAVTRERHANVYLSAAGGLGALYQLPIVAATRRGSRTTVLHHHSYAYIGRRSRVMAAITRAGKDDLIHVFLARGMKDDFERLYGSVRHLLLDNAVVIPPLPPATATTTEVLRLGHISNLSVDKGLDRVVEVFHQLRAAGTTVTLTLAGPADPEARRLIDGTVARNGTSVQHLGPVYGVDKEAFWRSIDVLLFPSRYANEAQPLVVLEALAAGVTPVVTDRGAMRETVGEAGIVLPDDETFVSLAVEQLAQLTSQPAVAQGRFRSLQLAGESHLSALLDHLGAVGPLGRGR